MDFEFKDNMLHLNLNGIKFNVSPIIALRGINAISRIAGEIDKKVISGDMSVEDACGQTAAHIDSILGDGATGRIFGSRTVSYEDLADIVAYIKNECNSFGRRKNSQYKGKK